MAIGFDEPPLGAHNGNNVIGAVVFFAYIAAALFFTGFILWDLAILWNRSYSTQPASQGVEDAAPIDVSDRRGKAQIFMGLSLISFAILSYNMLFFLIDSYLVWASDQGILLPRSLVGDQGLTTRPLYLWQWATYSTLFQDFSMAICSKPVHFWWTRLALLYTFGWNSFMSVTGITSSIPNLWAYFVLGQILPVSFSQNLFCTAFFLVPPASQSQRWTVSRQDVQILTTLGYFFSLWLTPALVSSTRILWLVLVIRLLLFLPYLLLQPIPAEEKLENVGTLGNVSQQHRWIFRITFVGSLLFMAEDVTRGVVSISSVRDNHAVSTLGFDYMVGLLSIQAFWLMDS